MRYELIVVWFNGDKDIYAYESREAAEQAGAGMKMALGEQIAWYGVRRKI